MASMSSCSSAMSISLHFQSSMEKDRLFKTVGEMALRYFDRSDEAGRSRFWRRLKRDTTLIEQLKEMGLQKGDKIFSPKMVQAIRNRWG